MAPYRRQALCSAAIVAGLMFGGCSPESVISDANLSDANQASLTALTPLERVGAGLAVALRDPSILSWVLDQASRSPYVEHRIPLRRVMLADTSAALREILRNAGIASDVASFSSTLPDLELYFPIAAHFEGARTAARLQVAVRSEGGDGFLILRRDGTRFRFGEYYDPGAEVTVVLGKSEIDYDVTSSAIRGGASTGSGMLEAMRTSRRIANAECDPEVMNCGGGGGGGTPPPSGGDTSKRTEFYFIQLNEHSEGLLMGLNEIEIFGSVNNAYHSCGSVTEVHYGTAYSLTFYSSDIVRRVATAIPVGTNRFTLEAFEDDDDRCIKRSGDDPLGNWTTGITISQYGSPFTTESPGLLRLAVGTVNQ